MSALFDQLAMTDSVPGSDVVQLKAPAESFTASTLQRFGDVLRRLATPYAVDARGRATASSYVASTLTPGVGHDFDGPQPRAVRSRAEERAS